MLSSRLKISVTRGEQKPLWQRPIPARVRRFTPSRSTAPTGDLIAATISPSVIISQRQIILPYKGFSSISWARRSSSASLKDSIPLRTPTKSGFFSHLAPQIWNLQRLSHKNGVPAACRRDPSIGGELERRAHLGYPGGDLGVSQSRSLGQESLSRRASL